MTDDDHKAEIASSTHISALLAIRRQWSILGELFEVVPFQPGGGKELIYPLDFEEDKK